MLDQPLELQLVQKVGYLSADSVDLHNDMDLPGLVCILVLITSDQSSALSAQDGCDLAMPII